MLPFWFARPICFNKVNNFGRTFLSKSTVFFFLKLDFFIFWLNFPHTDSRCIIKYQKSFSNLKDLTPVKHWVEGTEYINIPASPPCFVHDFGGWSIHYMALFHTMVIHSQHYTFTSTVFKEQVIQHRTKAHLQTRSGPHFSLHVLKRELNT